jgi:hypothetical protein
MRLKIRTRNVNDHHNNISLNDGPLLPSFHRQQHNSSSKDNNVLSFSTDTTAATTTTSTASPILSNRRRRRLTGHHQCSFTLNELLFCCCPDGYRGIPHVIFLLISAFAVMFSLHLVLNHSLVSWLHYYNNNSDVYNSNLTAVLKSQMDTLQRQLSSIEAKLPIYHEDERFFPMMIRDARHLVPTQSSLDFHIFDYVDLSSMQQGQARHSQLFHNAHFIDQSPCQVYSVLCYRHKIIQVFDYVLRHFPQVQYYFYMEADNDLCVPMSTIQALALQEQRYFINVGIGFSGWIMSRSFMEDFLSLYRNITFPSTNTTSASTAADVFPTTVNKKPEQPEIRPDVLASYYLTEKHAWTVTRQYWVSHTTLESLGVSSLTVKDRRRKDTGTRETLDKHLPKCLEPRRAKWPLGQYPRDPRDRFGWDYFDYNACPEALLFPCNGSDQLAQLVAEDWRIANESGAIA